MAIKMQATRCLPPKLTKRAISAYTILGFAGFAAANVVSIVLAQRWGLTTGERLIGFFTPPIAFIVVVTIATAIARTERIVFYQTACAGVVMVALIGWIAGVRVARLLDLACIGIGVFLVFGRVGCHAVACCHGRLGRGVTYGAAHVAVGFWARWSGRALWPVQLTEAVASAVLVGAALAASGTPGTAALIYVMSYATVRFGLELVRGDGVRPYAAGLSEAQWFAVATAVACATWSREPLALAIAGSLVAAAIALVATRKYRALFQPPHLHEIDRALAATADGRRHETSLGLAVSRHDLPDGRIDWVMSGEPVLTETTARRLAHQLWPTWELVAGRTAGVFHVVTSADSAHRAL